MSAVARYEPRELGAHELAALERQCDKFARSSLVPKALQGKPDDIMAIALSAHSLGMELSLPALNQFHVIEGRVEPSGQMCLGLVKSAGHRARLTEYTPERATVVVHLHGSDEPEPPITFTLGMATQAGLLDPWVEEWGKSERGANFKKTYQLTVSGEPNPRSAPQWAQKLIDAGDIKRRDNWFRYPADMLAAKAAKRAARFACPEVLFGMARLHWDEADGEPPAGVDGETGEIHADPTAKDDEPADPDEIDGKPHTSNAEAADAWDRTALQTELAALDTEHRLIASKAWKEAGLPKIDSDALTKDHEADAHRILSTVGLQQKEAYKTRQKRANALLTEIGVKGDDARHAAVREATGGETESTGRLSSTQIDAVVAWCERKKAEAAQGEWDDPDGGGQRDDEPPVQDELSADEF